jgi:hypothetical protein
MAFTVDVNPRVLEESQTFASTVNLGRRGDRMSIYATFRQLTRRSGTK